MLSRTQKQVLIGGIYIVVALLIGGGIIYAKYRPTCNDGKKDGQEEGVDCGTLACGKACEAPIQALQPDPVPSMVGSLNGDWDGYVKIYNPNANYGVADATYQLFIGGEPGPITHFYMLPGQTKLVVFTAVKVLGGPAVEGAIKSVEWEKVSSRVDNPFLVTRETYTSGVANTTYEAVINNNSNFDFDTVDVGVVVFNSAGTLIATSTTNLQTVLSHTDRSIKVSWPFPLPADSHVQIEVGTNLLNNANFLKTNGTQEKFQQYYQ